MSIDPTLATQIGEVLRQKGAFLAIAESCTGGLISHLITNVPGSSDYFLGSIISYSNLSKLHWLDVQEQTLQQHGAVSRACVLEMAHAIRFSLQSDYAPQNIIGLAVSGIAGPGGGTPQKPVGTVWVAIESAWLQKVQEFHFTGNRREIKDQSAQAALLLLYQSLSD